MSTPFRFVLGFMSGGLVAYFAAVIFLNMTESADTTAADLAFRSPHEIETQRWQRYGPKIMAVTVLGCLLGGVTAVILASNSTAKTPQRPRRSLPRTQSTPLDSEQFQRVLATCGWANLRNKNAEYVQGLIVGRLAESDPAIAHRVEQLDDFELESLVEKIQRHRARVSGAASG
jgi:hypothetical protein